MFKTKTSFISLVVLLAMIGCYSFAGDIVYIIKRTLDERVATLERKVAMMDLYFAERGIDLERTYGNRIQMVQEGRDYRRDHRDETPSVIVVPTGPQSAREAGRYLITFKDGSKMVVVTFEKTTLTTNDFVKGRTTSEAYVLHLENGQRINCPVKNVSDIKFQSWTKEE